MKCRFFGDAGRDHYVVVTNVPVIDRCSLALASAGPAAAGLGAPPIATGSAVHDGRSGWIMTYALRRSNDELVVGLCNRP